MELVWVSPEHPDFAAMAAELDATLRDRQGESQAAFAPYNLAGGLSAALVAYQDGRAVACGALKTHDGAMAEIKRVYVSPACRRTGLGRRIVEALQRRAAEMGFRTLVLETNPSFTDAVALYRGMGIQTVETFGTYRGMCTLCLGKTLP
jgi:ribosomal protein S18 acetylase RimI-like enzyme